MQPRIIETHIGRGKKREEARVCVKIKKEKSQTLVLSKENSIVISTSARYCGPHKLLSYRHIARFLFPQIQTGGCGSRYECLCGKLLGSFYDRMDVPNGPFFINERTSRRCRAGKKFRICMAMQFAQSLEAQKLAGQKTAEKRDAKGQEQAQ